MIRIGEETLKTHHPFLGFLIALSLLLCMPIPIGSSAIATDPVKVSVLNDMCGPNAGITASNVEAAKMP